MLFPVAGLRKTDRDSGLQFGLGELLFAAVAVAVGVSCWRLSSWDVGVLVAVLLLVLWRLRHHKYAAVPGVAVGALLAWATLGVGVDTPEVTSRTALFATAGAAINALVCRYWLEGLVTLGICAVVGVVISRFLFQL